MRTFFCIGVVLGLIFAIQGHHTVTTTVTAVSESDLRHHIFEHYDKLVRPVRDANHAVPVSIGLFPVGVKDVDVKEKKVKLDSWFYVKWEDEYLTWNKTDYNGLGALRLPASEVWKPDMSLYYATPDVSLQPPIHTQVVLYSNGTILWVPPFTFKSRCNAADVVVTDDTFQCTLQIGSWTYDVTLLDLQIYERDFETLTAESYQDTHPDWTLQGIETTREVKIYACCAEEYPVIKVKLTFKKKEHAHAH